MSRAGWSPSEFVEFPGVRWSSPEFTAVRRSSLGFAEYTGVRWSSLELHGVLWSFLVYAGVLGVPGGHGIVSR